MNILAITNHNGTRLAEVGFALGAIGGVVIALGRRQAAALGGLLIAAGFVLAIIASHWGHFG